MSVSREKFGLSAALAVPVATNEDVDLLRSVAGSCRFDSRHSQPERSRSGTQIMLNVRRRHSP